MELKINLPFQDLLQLVRELTPVQKAQLKQQLDEPVTEEFDKEETLQLLLNGPVYSESDIAIIEENRRSIAAWRTEG